MIISSQSRRLRLAPREVFDEAFRIGLADCRRLVRPELLTVATYAALTMDGGDADSRAPGSCAARRMSISVRILVRSARNQARS
jgi:hypothetical protein